MTLEMAIKDVIDSIGNTGKDCTHCGNISVELQLTSDFPTLLMGRSENLSNIAITIQYGQCVRGTFIREMCVCICVFLCFSRSYNYFLNADSILYTRLFTGKSTRTTLGNNQLVICK